MAKLTKNELVLAVVGSGHVGLPMAVSFAKAGCRVYAVDTDRTLVDQVNSGSDPIGEPGLQEEIARNISSGRLKATADLRQISEESDVFIISVPTPTRGRQPDLTFLIKAIEETSVGLKRGKTVVIVSSVPPGTVNGPVRSLLEQRSGLKAEEDFYLAYVPERITPGNALRDILENPRLVGGVGPSSAEHACQLFQKICKKVTVTSVERAEVSKLAENTFRDVNIAFANELALLCETLGVDVMEIIELANTHPRVKIHKPGGGVGGPCLPKDPWLLIHSYDRARIIPTARIVNDGMPEHIVSLVERALKSVGKTVSGSATSVIGTAYKGGTSDSRLSPSKTVIEGLMKRGSRVIVYDPYSSESFGGHQADSLEECLIGSDCLVVMTDHQQFVGIDLRMCRKVMSKRPVIVDGRRIINSEDAKKLGFVYCGIGCSIDQAQRW